MLNKKIKNIYVFSNTSFRIKLIKKKATNFDEKLGMEKEGRPEARVVGF